MGEAAIRRRHGDDPRHGTGTPKGTTRRDDPTPAKSRFCKVELAGAGISGICSRCYGRGKR
jgi:hypothetical protein